MIFDYIADYLKKDIYPFHMPGHKRNLDFFGQINFLDFDMTEFDGMDNFHNPKEIIKESQILAAKVFNSKYSFYLTNGSSSGIMAAIMSVCKKGDKILLARNSHKSAYNGVMLAEASPVYIYPKITDDNLTGGMLPDDVEREIIKNPDIKAVFITSPTYEGFCSNVREISKITKKYNKILIVDEAHGAHFAFSDKFPESSVNYADIIIHSLHKTMPSLGQSAIIHITNEKIDIEKIRFYIGIFHTTSPSYIIMALIDRLITNLANNKIPFDEYTNLLLEYRGRLCNFKQMKLLDIGTTSSGAIVDIDISKLTFFCTFNCAKLENIFAEKFRLQLEFFSKNHFVALTSVCDTNRGFERFSEALTEIDKSEYTRNISKIFSYPKPEIKFGINKAINNKSKSLPLAEAVGHISADFIIPYPPGIPLVVPGEIITKEIYFVIKELEANEINFVGFNPQSVNIL